MSGCLGNKEKIEFSCPTYPKAGTAVVKELKTINPKNFMALHDWLDRLDKFESQLEVTQ